MWRAGPDAKPRGRRQSGFTLLEILVVVGLVAMLSLAVLVVPVWVDDQRQLDSESASLADTLTMLNEQSLFSGRLMALRVTERGWTPLTYDVGERAFVPAQGNGLQANRLPESLELTWQYDDLPDDEAQRLIAALAEHILRPEFVYRHQWQPGDLLMWDNCTVQHRAIADYALPQRRCM